MNIALQHDAQNLAALLPPLLLEAERIAATVYQGIHGRRRAGMGESFWQFRHYAPGDAAARIDWRQSARTDKLFVREREWEAAQSAYLWADRSGSMRYASQKNRPTKEEQAQLLMFALADLLLRAGESVTWLSKAPITLRSKNDFNRLAGQITPVEIGDNLPPQISVRRHAHVILASDFLMEPAELTALLRRYAALNLRGALVHILDPAEEELIFEGRLELLGCEGEAPLLLPKAAALREAYGQRMAAHKAWLMQMAESAGWFYLRHVTDQPPHLALVRLFQNLAADRRGI